MLHLQKNLLPKSLLALALATPGLTLANDIEEVIVTAEFRDLSLRAVPASVSLLDAQALANESARHLEDVLNNVANLNWSGATSRPRYFQIRGVGEQEDYQGAPNSSVGFVVDDIDLSGLGMAASTFDLQQVEVLRGPQGTRFGANALAGVIYLKSEDPTDTFALHGQATVGSDNQLGLGLVTSGPVTDAISYRVAVESQTQDGFRDNSYLNRSDTNGRDELTSRIKLRGLFGAWHLDLNGLYAHYDNGYDAWTLDNNGFDTLSDQPGTDNQETLAGSLKAVYSGDSVTFTSITSATDTDHQHAYDGDWANPDYWAAKSCTAYDADWNPIGLEPCVYNYWWDKQASRQTLGQELRLASTEQSKLLNDSTHWLLGAYLHKLEESNDLYSEYNGWPDEVLVSDYRADSLALFAQTDTDLGAGYSLSVGLRGEQRSARYSDSAGDNFSPDENLWGGHLALSKVISAAHNGYVRLARGYKAGGFNMGLPPELADRKLFDAEALLSAELGLKSLWAQGRVSTSATLFYMDRQDQQVDASQQDPDDPQRFVLYTENAGESHNYGAELDALWVASDSLEFNASLGYLQAQYGDYRYQDKYGSPVDLSGRDLAHAPRWTYSAGLSWRPAGGFFANLSLTGKSDFYYSDSNDSRSDAYTLLNGRVGYAADDWTLYLWGRNLTDEQYGVRGFYFGNDPSDDWAEHQYIRFGDPRQVGLTFNLMFE